MICITPINHVRNLDMALNNDHNFRTSPTNADRPPPADHAILLLTKAFRFTIQANDIQELTAINESYIQSLQSNLEFLLYDRSVLRAIRQIALNILNSQVATSTPLPTSPTNGQVPAPPVPLPTASFKPPKLVTDNWSGLSYDFYPWLSSVLNGFTLTRCDDPAKLVLTLQAIPLNKRGSFNTITDWTNFKARLIEEFGSIDIFGHNVNQMFYLLPRYKSVQEVAEDLAPKIKTLLANLEIIQQFHDVEDLHNVAITLNLVPNVMRSLPMEVMSSFNDQFLDFRSKDPAKVRFPATFKFLAQLVNKLEKNYRSNPTLFDRNFPQ